MPRQRAPLLDVVQGEEIYNSFGNRVVLSRTSSLGKVVAVKQRLREMFNRSEARMMDFVSREAKAVLAPCVLGCYDIDSDDVRYPITVMVSEVVEGVLLDKVWHSMNQEQQDSIKDQLRQQLHHFRQCTQPFIGRVDRQPVRNFL